ncbi:MAG: tetratricopeptide repeat protein [Thermoanaerobaculia bacterium]
MLLPSKFPGGLASGLLFLLLSLAPAARAAPPASPAAARPAPAALPTAGIVDSAQRAVDAGDAEQALELLAQVLKREPKNARALLVRSSANCVVGELDDCKRDLDQALTLDPSLRQGWLNRSGIAIAEKRYDDALAALAQAEKLDPQASDNAANLGAVYLLQGKLEPASQAFARHLAANPESADAYYLVATNFALAGYSALAAQHLGRAIELDERSRVRARGDANFADVAGTRPFQLLLTTDSYVPPTGSATAVRIYRSPYKGSGSPILVALLNALQIAGKPLDPHVEVTDDWALLWSEARIKISRRSDSETAVELSAVPGKFTPELWDAASRSIYDGVDRELLKLERASFSRP